MNIDKKPELHKYVYKSNIINWAKNFAFALLLVVATLLCESKIEFKYNLGIALLASTIVTIVFETIKLVERLESISKIKIEISKEVFLIIIEIYNEIKTVFDNDNEELILHMILLTKFQ